MFLETVVFVSTFPLQVFSSPTCGQSSMLPLQSLVRSVLDTVIASKAGGAVPSYLGGFKKWKAWALSNLFGIFQLTPLSSLFICSLVLMR